MKKLIILLLITMYSIALQAQTSENEGSSNGDPIPWIDRPFNLSIGVGWTDNGRFQGDAAGNFGGTAYALETQERYYSGTQAFSIEIISSQKNSWGFIVGFLHNGTQRLSEDKSLHQSQRQSLQNPSKMQMSSTYFGTVYRWDIFYIPIGINIGNVNYTPPNGTSTKLKNGAGVILTLGWKIYEKLAFEIVTQNANTDLTNTSGSQSDVVDGIFGTTSFMLKLLL